MSIASVLNSVTTAGQTRAAIGEALNALGRTYPLLGKLTSDRAASAKGILDASRGDLEAWYRDVKPMSYAAPYKETFASKRKLIERAYVEIAGVEGEARYVPQTTNLQILTQSLKEAPAVFAAGLGSVTAAVGEGAGSAVGGIFKGLGVSGTLTLVVVGVVILLVVTRGSILGRLFGGGGGA